MSEFKFSCPHCSQVLQATPEYSGAQINCPVCQQSITVPQVGVGAPAQQKTKLSKSASTIEHTVTTPNQAAAAARVNYKKKRVGVYLGWAAGALAVGALAMLTPTLLDKYHQHQETVKAEAAAEFARTNIPPPPPEYPADEILKRVDATYKGMKSFSADATSTAVIDMSGINPALKQPQTSKSTMSIMLAQPNLYKFQWEREMGRATMKGAAWSSGGGDYILMAKKPVKLRSRESVLESAGQASGMIGIGFAGMFFEGTNSLATQLKNPSKRDNQMLNGRKCYVVTGEAASQNLVFWVHHDDYLIAQSEIDLPIKVDPAVMARMNKVQKAQVEMAQRMKGSITETYDNIQTNQDLTADAFQVSVDATANATPTRKPAGQAAPVVAKKRKKS